MAAPSLAAGDVRRQDALMFGTLKRAAFGVLIKVELSRLRGIAKTAASKAAGMPFPATLEALDERSSWCVEGMRSSGAIPADAAVTKTDVAPFATNLAFRSILGLVTVDWQTPEGSQASLQAVAKMAPLANDLGDHAIYLLQKNHEKEVGFYTDYAATSGLACEVYRADIDAASGHFCVLMKYYGDHIAHSESDGCPPVDALRLARALARFHAQNWNVKGRLPKAMAPTPDVAIDWFASLLEGPERDTLSQVARKAWRHNLTGPQTILHGDCRVGNVLFAPESAELGASDVILYDWQACRTGRGVFDLVYFAVLCMSPADRRAHWDELLTAYHEGLVAAGVSGYSRATLEEDAFNSTLLTSFFVTAPFLSKESSTTELNASGIDELADAWRERTLAALTDMDLERVAAWCGLPHEAILRAAAVQGVEG